jgi:hypothetical protein
LLAAFCLAKPPSRPLKPCCTGPTARSVKSRQPPSAPWYSRRESRPERNRLGQIAFRRRQQIIGRTALSCLDLLIFDGHVDVAYPGHIKDDRRPEKGDHRQDNHPTRDGHASRHLAKHGARRYPLALILGRTDDDGSVLACASGWPIIRAALSSACSFPGALQWRAIWSRNRNRRQAHDNRRCRLPACS